MRESALRRYLRTKSPFDKIDLNRMTALSRNVKRKARKRYWQDFVSSLNSDTPMSKIWKRIGKIKGKYPPNRPPSLLQNGILYEDPKVVADILANHFADVSSDEAYPDEFQIIKLREERNAIDFSTRRTLEYNDPIRMNVLKSALQLTKNSAPPPI